MSILVTLFVPALSPPDAGEQATAAPHYSPEAAPKAAQENYKAFCRPCHGPDGTGLVPATSLTDGMWKHASTLPAVARTIREGVTGTLMLPFKDKLSREEILGLAKIARQFDLKFTRKVAAKHD